MVSGVFFGCVDNGFMGRIDNGFVRCIGDFGDFGGVGGAGGFGAPAGCKGECRKCGEGQLAHGFHGHG